MRLSIIRSNGDYNTYEVETTPDPGSMTVKLESTHMDSGDSFYMNMNQRQLGHLFESTHSKEWPTRIDHRNYRRKT